MVIILSSCSGPRCKSYKLDLYRIVIAATILFAAVTGYCQIPDFTLATTPASIQVPQLAHGSTIVSTTITSGFKSSIDLTATGVPAGATLTFSRSSIPSPGIGTSALTIAVGSNTPLGVYSVTVAAASGNTVHNATLTLTVVSSRQLPAGYGWHQLANTNMTSVCLGRVSNGMYSDPTMTTTTTYDFDCNQFVPWSGAVTDDNHQRLIVWGGGHSDYAGNEVSALNLNGTPSWQAITGPTIPVPYVWDGNNWEGLQPYFVRAADGGQYQPGASPASRHTYNGIQYVPYQNKLYAFGGALANGGFLSQEAWTLDLTATSWSLIGPPYSLSPGFPTTAYNPNTGHIIMHDKSWTLLDFNPANDTWTTLTTQYHVDDGTTAVVDPVNNLFVVMGADGTNDNLGYPNVPTTRTIQVFSLTPPYAMLTLTDPSCDLIYRDGGLAWDSALGLVVGYPGGGNQAYLFNTGGQDVVTPFGTVPSHKCLDVPISLNPSPVKGVDYPQDPEGTLTDGNLGIYGRFGYFPSLDTFALVNDRTKNAWTLQLTGGSQAPNFAVSVPAALTVAEGSQGTLAVTTTVLNGFNNAIALTSAGAPAGATVSFAPATIGAPGAGSSTMTVIVGASTPVGTYPIVVNASGGGDNQNPIVTLTVTASGQPSFTLSALPASLSVQQGNQGSSTITSTISGGFNSAISLAASGAPSGTTVSFNPQTLPAPGSGSSTMNITVGSSTAAGTYPITVTGNGGGVQQTTTFILTVTAPQQPSFTLSASPALLTVQQGNQGTSTITSTLIGGFNSAISLSASGAPTGTTVSLNPQTLPAPGSGTSTLTISVGASTATGSYPITVTGNGGGVQQNTTVTLTVTAAGAWQQGFDFRSTAGYVTDPPGDLGVLATTLYPTRGSGVTYGWVRTSLVQGRDRNAHEDARLAGIDFATNGAPATFYVDLPSAGSYNLSLALGDAGYMSCWVQCQIQFLDGSTVLATITKGLTTLNYFYDAKGNDWSGAAWPASNLSQPVTLTGSRLTVMVGTNRTTGDSTPIAFLGVTQTSSSPNYTLSASPAALTVQQGNQGTSTITSTISGGFSGAISLSALGAPAGTTVSFNPQTLPAPGSGNSTMTITVGSSTPAGTYPITVTGNGGGLQRSTTLTLTVTAQQQANFSLSALPALLSIPQGNQGNSTITSTISGGFNSAIILSASGTPSGTTISFSPNPIPAPGSGTSTMTVTVGGSTAIGTYPITITGNGGGLQRNIALTLTVTSDPNFTLTASPASLTVQQGNHGTSTITSTLIGSFNSAISLSASGAPTGTTVSLNPQTLPAPGSGTSTLTISVGASTATGSYPITVTGNGGGVQQNTTVTLTVTAAGAWQQGFDFRSTAGYVTDPPGDLGVLATTLYPTRGSGVTYGWVRTSLVQGRDRNAHEDARLAGIDFATNGAPATFYVDLPSAGSYNLSLALGDAGYMSCWVQCQIQFLDGSTVLATITKGLTTLNYFYDAKGNDWSGAAWPASNLSQPVTLTGSRLTVMVGTNRTTGDSTPIAFLGVTQTSSSPNYTLSASPAALTVQQGNQGTSTITSTISGGFSGAISLSALGAPAGTTVSFNPQTLPAPGSGNSTMTITVGSSTPAGTYPITVTGNGGGLQRSTTVTLTVTAQQQANFSLSASPISLSISQGNQGNSTVTATISGGFNSAIILSASGTPSGTTISFSPNPIPAPGSGTSSMTVTVGLNTTAGTYPIAITGNGGGVQQTTIVILTVTPQQQPSFTLSASPASLTIQQGNQGGSTITSSISNGFNSAISLSASGAPTGTTVSFNPQTLPAPGSGISAMTITVGSNTATGVYSITVTGNGGGVQQNTTVFLTVASSGGGGGGNGIIVYSTSGSPQTNRMVSIGRVFKPGDIPNFAQAVVAGNPILTQCDVKNRWEDGSLKFGIVSFVVPTVSTSGTQVTFQNQGTGNNTNFLMQSDMLNPAYDFDGVMQLTGTASPSISARSVLQAGDFRYWLQGPIVTAVVLEDRNGRAFDVNTDGAGGNPLHPIFEAWFYPQTSQVELGFTLENSWASSNAANSARNQTYGLTLTTGFNSPTTQLTQPAFTQDIFTRWRRSYWIDSAPAPIQINYNWPYLASTTAYANFNQNYTPNESDLEAMYAVYTNEPAGRLTIPGIDQLSGSGGIVNYDENMNAAGYAPWIGPYSQWDVDYLMTGDNRMRKMMTDNADLAGRFPIFFREADHNAGTGHYFDAPGSGSVDPYGHVVSINARQYATLNLANEWDVSCNNNSADLIATSLPGDGSGWYGVPGDTSHLPDFAYVPYTLTGKYFYLENEMLEAGFAAGHGLGCYSATSGYGRMGHYGMLYSTTREMAWALRTMAFAAFIAPDGTPEGPYFASKVGNNVAMLEGEHALSQTVNGADATWAYNWGKNYFQFSQAANPSTLTFWRMGDCQDGTTTCYVANGNGANNNVNAAIVQSAESGFMSSFIDIVLGLTNQLGVVDTTSILQRDARRYLNILLNPAVNHYLIEQYVYPTTLVGPVCQNPANPGCLWISDWNTFQAGYLSLPTAWSNRQVDYGAEAASALSFMTNFTVDGYSGMNAWNFYSTSDSAQLGIVYHNEPQWSIAPLQ